MSKQEMFDQILDTTTHLSTNLDMSRGLSCYQHLSTNLHIATGLSTMPTNLLAMTALALHLGRWADRLFPLADLVRSVAGRSGAWLGQLWDGDGRGTAKMSLRSYPPGNWQPVPTNIPTMCGNWSSNPGRVELTTTLVHLTSINSPWSH